MVSADIRTGSAHGQADEREGGDAGGRGADRRGRTPRPGAGRVPRRRRRPPTSSSTVGAHPASRAPSSGRSSSARPATSRSARRPGSRRSPPPASPPNSVGQVIVTGPHAAVRSRWPASSAPEGESSPRICGHGRLHGRRPPRLLLPTRWNGPPAGESCPGGAGRRRRRGRCSGPPRRSTPHPRPVRSSAQVVGRDDVRYRKFLSWHGMVTIEPPRRPEPARASASAAARSEDWKFGFVGGRDRSTGAVHLPPARVSYRGGADRRHGAVPMADTPGTIVTFTVDRLAYSPSPPSCSRWSTSTAAGGGRLPMEAAPTWTADDVAIGAAGRDDLPAHQPGRRHPELLLEGPRSRPAREGSHGLARHQGQGRHRGDGLHPVPRALGQGRRRPADRRGEPRPSRRPRWCDKDTVDAVLARHRADRHERHHARRAAQARGQARHPGRELLPRPAPRPCARPPTRWHRAPTTWPWRSASRR